MSKNVYPLQSLSDSWLIESDLAIKQPLIVFLLFGHVYKVLSPQSSSCKG